MYYPVWDDAYKKALAANRKVEAANFLSRYLMVLYHMYDAIYMISPVVESLD